MSDIIRMMQFRKVGCLDWYDGTPRGDGPYETRAVFMPDIAADRSTENGRLLRMSETLAAENKRLEAELAQANLAVEALKICIVQDDEREAELKALVAEMVEGLSEIVRWVDEWEPDFEHEAEWPGLRHFRDIIARAKNAINA